jgi:predicted DNA-binding transcriptional regulator AlpA
MSTNTGTKLLDTAAAAEKLTVKKNTLEIWRLQGRGPVFRKIGRLVRYAESDIDAYLESTARTSTSAANAAAY